MSLEIRPARPEEIAACAELHGRVARATFTWLPIDDPEGDILRAAADEEFFVAVEDERVVGFAAFYRPDNFLHSLFVDLDRQSQGIGLRLLAQVDAIADAPISLKAQLLNHRAVAFYRREGFAEYERGIDPKDGSTWIRMRRL